MKVCIVHRYPILYSLSTNPSLEVVLGILQKEGHETFFVSYLDEKENRENTDKILRKYNINFEPIGLVYNRKKKFDRIFKTILFLIISPLFLAVLAWKKKIDVVYCDDALPLYYYLIKKMTGKRVIYRMGDLFTGYLLNPTDEKKSRLFKLILKIEIFMLNGIDSVLAISNVLREQLIAWDLKPEKVEVVTECIDLEMFNPDFSGEEIRSKHEIGNKILIMFHGVLVPWKGTKTLIRAIPLVLEDYPEVKFMIVGDGPSFNDLKNLARELNVDNSVIFTRWIPFVEIPYYISACDIGVVMRSNNLANDFVVTTALLQYLGSGKMVIAPNLRAISKIITSEDIGLLFKPDNPIDLAKKIITLLNNRDLIGDGHKRILRIEVSKKFDQTLVGQTLADIITCSAREKH